MVRSHPRFQGATSLLYGHFWKSGHCDDGKNSDAKGVGTRFEKYYLLFERVHQICQKNEKKISSEESRVGVIEATIRPIVYKMKNCIKSLISSNEFYSPGSKMVSTPEQTKSVRWSLRQSDFRKSKFVNELRTAAIFVYIYVRESAVEYEKTLRYDT